MNRACLVGCMVVFLAAVPASAASIDVGTHYLLPNTPRQPVPIFVTGGETIAGMNLRGIIGGGGAAFGGVEGPGFQEPDGPPVVDRPSPPDLWRWHTEMIAASIWEDHNADGGRMYDLEYRQLVIGNIVAGDNPSDFVTAEGLLVTLLVDTTAFSTGSWDLALRAPPGYSEVTELLDDSPTPRPVPLNITDGVIQIASGRSVVHDGGFGTGSLDEWNVAGEGTAEVVEFPIGSGNYVAGLTAGSPVVLGQQIDTPDRPFLAAFDYTFQSAGTLGVTLNGQSIGLIEATGPGDLRLARVQVDDAGLMGLSHAELAFHFNGETGSQVLLDNIAVRGVPEPTTLAMLLGLLAGVPLVLVCRKRTRSAD